ncbi:MAG TPA: zinc-dependent alcohol dehydrogenase family protein [Candidatus Marinimicrobia bacterium]|jgi:threonine dehydrogenase-like Zn-dependent dehydrogenase|nr:zinc-dependent alcohol dehydrogenase family protein [Candidatus Neomarinimicrobiota bacterium]HQH56721.1 zinc-dependent alcohol dehydrogenase family protein [Candidatus Neomarinimicrobiota bacterium]HQM36023.1 zinc-dependent alcohol dehydrogenase family protein [Candidatus Neomarinimicrobiota bacterium]HRD17552.1 zinc-dependent alcohol dehydrogenase family protein [Candidatus Neomarinimicrobiota bacterium]
MKEKIHATIYDGKEFKLTYKSLREIRPNEVLVKVDVCGVCGTDIKIIAGQSHATPPVILGHEFCGHIVEKGEEVSGFSIGDFVAVDPNIYCGYCQFCRRGQVNLCENLQALGVDIDGGFAEYCIVQAGQCYRLPKNTDPIQASLLEPLSCVLYGFQKAAIKAGERVLIVGGGMIGIIMLKLVRLSSACQIIVIEPDIERRKFCLKMGADLVFTTSDQDERKIFSHTQGGAEVVIECVGAIPAADQVFRLVKNGGRVIIFGVSPIGGKISISPYEIYRRDISVIGSFLNPFTFKTAVDLLENGRIELNDLDIKTFKLADIHNAFDNQKQHKSLKTVIDLR